MAMTRDRILQALVDGELDINPFNREQLSAASYDVRLASELLIYTEPVLDPKRKNPTRRVAIPEDGYTLVPGEFYLASTLEWFHLKGVEAVLDGKSTYGRLAVRVHCTAGYLDPGFRGYVTCEIDVVKPVIVYPGQFIGQVRFTKPDGVITAYSGKYLDQVGPVESRSYLDFADGER